MSNNQDKIPEEVKNWIESECPNWARYDSGVSQKTAWENGAVSMYRHLSKQQGPRWAKASETPKKTGKYYCGVRVDGEFEKHVIEWDGKCWGEIEEYDRYDDCEIIEWLDESSPVTSIRTPEQNHILVLSEWLNKEFIWQEKQSQSEFHRGILEAYQSVADQILKITAPPSAKESVTSTQEEKEECTCLYGPSDANPHCKHPNCFKPENIAAPKVDREKEREDYRKMLFEIGEFLESKDYLAFAEDVSALLRKYPHYPTPPQTDKQ